MINHNSLLKLFARLTLFATFVTLLVIPLGAYTRLTDAGLGCPDWPGCYGHFMVPSTPQAIHQAETHYPSTPVIKHKAWAEMAHRYLAGTLALLVILISFLSIWVALKQGVSYLFWVGGLFLLIIYQAALGMLTVTLKLLPLVVTQHLLGGMFVASLLWILHLKTKSPYRFSPPVDQNITRIQPWALLGLLLLFLQISLGAWTSTNYASVSCPSFPYCQAGGVMHYDFKSAFNILSPVGINYEGGVLNNIARMTIQMTHRWGALLTTLYLLFFLSRTLFVTPSDHPLRKLVLLAFGVLSLQVFLGILNVVLKLPLPIAVAHNLVAAILLLTLVTLNYRLISARKEDA